MVVVVVVIVVVDVNVIVIVVVVDGGLGNSTLAAGLSSSMLLDEDQDRLMAEAQMDATRDRLRMKPSVLKERGRILRDRAEVAC